VTFFEILLALLTVAIVLLQVSRRLPIPYPTMLAAAGVGLALIPGTPHVGLDPHTALPLFIAPVLVDAAFDFPPSMVRTLWRPLVALAVVAVVLSAGAVALLGVAWAGLPVFAALALGAIVAPPDAAAATAVIGSVNMPRRSIAVLKGESMLNDGSALLLFSAAVFVQQHGGLDGATALQLALAVPGGVLLGVVLARLYRHVVGFVSGTLGGNILEFLTSFAVWIVAERLHLSAVLCVVAFAMTLAGHVNLAVKPRVRIHSYAVWETAVFLLNVLAFLLMGFQARAIVEGMEPGRLGEAAWFAAAVVGCLIVVRMAWVLVYNRLANRLRWVRGGKTSATLRQGVLIGWCGMRGFVTLAAAFALPASFPQRDLIVLTAFAVVLATLVIQGLTLAPVVRLLGLDGDNGLDAELARVRAELATAALAELAGTSGPASDHLRYELEAQRAGAAPDESSEPLEQRRRLGLAAVRRRRARLEELRGEQDVGADAYLLLQEELDFAEVALTIDIEEHLEES
jgi:CPA1 family monovalent cation:H+ antiporter